MNKTRVGLGVCLLLAGCTQDILTLGQTSPLESGIYSGSVSCSNTTITEMLGTDQTTAKGTLTVTISDNGLPLSQGEEIFEGFITEQQTGDVIETRTITDITITPDGLTIREDAESTVTLLGDTVPVTGTVITTYELIAKSTISYSQTSQSGATFPEAGLTVVNGTCSGTLN